MSGCSTLGCTGQWSISSSATMCSPTRSTSIETYSTTAWYGPDYLEKQYRPLENSTPHLHPQPQGLVQHDALKAVH